MKQTQKKRFGKKRAFAAILLALAVLAAAFALRPKNSAGIAALREKAELLSGELLSDQIRKELGTDPLGELGYEVFFSVSDGTKRAEVYSASGSTPEQAWANALRSAEKGLRKSGTVPLWVKADAVYLSQEASAGELKAALTSSREGYFRYGVAFDSGYGTALLEGELNGAKIFDYAGGGVDLAALNSYLQSANRRTLSRLPQSYWLFRCFSRFCDEDNKIYRVSARARDYGHRRVENVDKALALQLAQSAAEYLLGQLKDDGSFVYGWYPRSDSEINDYNMVRHAGTVWALINSCRMAPDSRLQSAAEKAIDYMLSQVVYNGDIAYLYEAKNDEIKLGGCGIAVIALCEYMDVFGSDKYAAVCSAMGEGILTMLDTATGCYYHVLNGDFSRKEETRSVYYDGEAAFALCRLYGLTGEQKWLDAAKAAADHFIAADYTQYKDNWVSYAMNELTKYEKDNFYYYVFALLNAQANLSAISAAETTSPAYLELLMATFELYDRMYAEGMEIEGFGLDSFLAAIQTRAVRQLNGYFYPEVAMYMQNPQRILNTFMVRQDGFRVRIDDEQHNILGYYLYWKNYDRLLACGLPTG